MKKLQIRNSILLFSTAFIWGTAFVAQSVGMDYIEPFTFSTVRSFIGSIFLLPCIWIFGKKEKGNRKELVLGGIFCGMALCIATNLQQIGLLYTSVGKSGFLTALYIVIVPVFGIFFGKKPGIKLCIAVCCAVVGLYLLCMKSDGLRFEFGDILLLLGAVFFSVHILVIDYYNQRADGVKLSCIQFLVCGIISLFCMELFEHPLVSAVWSARLPLLYVGVLSSGVGYTLQIIGQKDMNPVVASLIMSLESVISAIAGWVVLGQVLSCREILGCAVMFLAIVIAQLPEKFSLKKLNFNRKADKII